MGYRVWNEADRLKLLLEWNKEIPWAIWQGISLLADWFVKMVAQAVPG